MAAFLIVLGLVGFGIGAFFKERWGMHREASIMGFLAVVPFSFGFALL